VKLNELLRRLPDAELTGEGVVEVSEVTHDSRRVSSGSLFVAIHGLVTDGNQFVDQARKKGAAAIVSELPPRPGGTWVKVVDARLALAVLSAAALGDPAEKLGLVGVTGTNGKTTTTHLIDAVLRTAGEKVGLVGTVHYRIGDRLTTAVRTTPESSDLQALFREMVDAGCRRAVLEVSSHSLELKRVHGCRFEVAVFTNLTRDHLDFHGDMDRYFEAKRRLFDTLLREDGRAILNADDDRVAELASASRAPVWTYGHAPARAGAGKRPDIHASNIRLSLDGSRFAVRTPVGPVEIHSPLLGRFNVSNLLAALGATLALGVPKDVAAAGLASLPGVPGRLERVNAGQDFAVIVDYAHTDDALKNLLETVRELGPRRVITVFGCGGDRDRTKRPLMGAVASRLSDAVIVTSDNPRSEPPEAIIEEIRRGMPAGRGADVLSIVDRRDAIARALEMARTGVAVVIAGKGHETSQTLRDRTVPFDDRQVVRDILRPLSVRGGRA
jgi:UDP-N-acetylmuramoyl-L-alanyl-D-glutamate--2,6-diaminopimelate ligase